MHGDGVEFEVQAKLRRADASDDEWDDLQGRFDEYGRQGRRNTGRLRVGVLLADGARAVSAPRIAEPDAVTSRYRLTRRGGGGTGSDAFHETDWTFWLWPLPPDGPMVLVADWPALSLPERRVEIDGGALSSAAARAVTIWPDDAPGPSTARPSWSMRI